MTLEVVHRHDKLAAESGVEYSKAYGADFWSVCREPKLTLRICGVRVTPCDVLPIIVD